MALPMSLEQGRAKAAYTYAIEGEKIGSDYKSYVKKIPMLIKTNGLGATMAFVFAKSKGNKAYGLIYKQTTNWIKDEKKILSFEKNDFAKTLTEIDSAEYRQVTVEVLALFTWLRRFAEGLILK